MQWVAKLNDSNEQCAFIVNGEKFWDMHSIDLISKVWKVLIQESFQTLISQVKLECSNKFPKLFIILLKCIEYLLCCDV
jgi:hypothetical protein